MARVRVKVEDNQPKESVTAESSDVEVPSVNPAPELPAVPEAVASEQPPASGEINTQSAIAPSPASQPRVIVLSHKMLIMGGVLLAVLIIAIVLLTRDSGGSNATQNSNATTPQSGTPDPQAEALKYHEEVSKYVDVPQGQTPSLVAVSDPAKLAEKSPVLFKNAQKDDIVLLYLNPDKTGKAILYRPSTKKLIAIVDGVNLGTTPAAATTPAPTTKPSTNAPR